MREWGKVYCCYWNSGDIRGLSDQGKLLGTYLLSTPHSNIIGCFLLPDLYVADDLVWPLETVRQTLSEIFAKGFAYRFLDGRHIVICRYLRWNPIENGNVLTAALRQALTLPPDPALSFVINGLEPYVERFGKGSETVWQTLRERLPKPFPNIEPEPEPEPEPGLEPEPETGAPASPPLALIAPQQASKNDMGFEEWWSIYPKKQEQKEARERYLKIIRKKLATVEQLIDGAQRYADSVRASEYRFIKKATTWLEKECWRDEPPPPSRASSGMSAAEGVFAALEGRR